MYIRIERGSSTPISRQIAAQVRAQCLGGLLKPGQYLPSVRQLAAELVVNVNTVVRVYERLAAEGLVEMRHGEGTIVLPLAAKAKQDSKLKRQREQFSSEFQLIVQRGLLLGFSVPELRRQLASAAAEVKAEISNLQSAENQS
jgi:GntR family transcriptional regulator